MAAPHLLGVLHFDRAGFIYRGEDGHELGRIFLAPGRGAAPELFHVFVQCLQTMEKRALAVVMARKGGH